MADKISVMRGGKSLQTKVRSIARTMTTSTQVATLPRGSRILGFLLSGTASDAGTTATLSIGSTSANANEYVNAVDVTKNGFGNSNGVLLTPDASGLRTYSAALSPAIVGANTTAEQTFTVNGLLTSDIVFVNKPTTQAGLGIVGARVSAANTLAITFSNNTGVGITPTAAETYLVGVLRASGTAGTIGSAANPPTQSDLPVFVKYAETGTASTAGAWKVAILYTTGNDLNDDTI